MRIAIVSDIHGNRHAFEAVLDAVGASDSDELWCLGDLVGYGGDPDACVQLAREHAAICLAGNHDLGVRGDLPLEQFSRGAGARGRMDPADDLERRRWSSCERCEPANIDEQVGLYHASPRDPVWEYVLSPLQAELCLDAQEHRVCLIGHSHVALSFWRSAGSPATGQTRGDGEGLEIDTGEWLINPGSVGQPRDGDPRAAWLELDTERWTAVYRRTDYDIAGRAGGDPGGPTARFARGASGVRSVI